MKKCCVKVTSEEEFEQVEDICFKNGIGWSKGETEHRTHFQSPHTLLYIYPDDKDLTYSHNDSNLDYISFNEFIKNNKKIEDCYVKIKTTEDFKKIQEICFENDVYWSDNTKEIVKSLPYHNTYLCVTNNLTYSSECSEMFLYPGKFIEKYDKSPFFGICSNKQYRIKTENEFINEFGENWETEIRKHWNSSGSMDFLFGRKLTNDQSEKLIKDEIIEIDGWQISKDMMIKDDGIVSSIKKRIKTILHQETKITLNNSLYKKNKPNLDQKY